MYTLRIITKDTSKPITSILSIENIALGNFYRIDYQGSGKFDDITSDIEFVGDIYAVLNSQLIDNMFLEKLGNTQEYYIVGENGKTFEKIK